MSKNGKLTIVIGCGAHHIPYHYRFLQDALHSAGYAVKIVQLPSTSAEVVEDAMSKDVRAIRQVVEGEIRNGKHVIMVLHSWSGFVGSAAVEGLEENVKHIVYLASWIQPSGKSSCEWLGVEELPIYEVKDDLNHVKEPIAKFYNGLPDEVVQDSLKYLLPMVNSVTKTPLRIPAVWDAISCTYVICDEDDAVPPAFAEMMIRDSHVRAEVVRMAGGHSPFLGDRVGTLVDILRKAAGEDIGKIEGVRVDEEKLL
ncbi:hypothetical protein M409DRAFT_15711 [Zasmidium cellare ATCC 36951]|uniref:AB hydrolase-1 domain-containing protein n=1 Tax=Zasmidium cellare ATCC 36951 TaxID=1080233 RepID=A0A6A6D720_ZASCE|nr:uncharacterized protein M409DRAFT_15711 [Zasmidium cellare ATCC 36951]KAF2173426.1 hypothetical protein M409DRAFT_15711 [Zasmidium cellare ATCC 36951]